MFYGLFDLIEKDYFKKGTSIVALHTGGLQGIEGFNALKLKNAPVKIDISQ
jgi:1-aminocyclopropane-1-carboxylate deaminase